MNKITNNDALHLILTHKLIDLGTDKWRIDKEIEKAEMELKLLRIEMRKR